MVAFAQRHRHVRLWWLRQNHDLGGRLAIYTHHFFAGFGEMDCARRRHRGLVQRSAAYRPGVRAALPPNSEQRAEHRIRWKVCFQPLLRFRERLTHRLIAQTIRRIHGPTVSAQGCLEQIEP